MDWSALESRYQSARGVVYDDNTHEGKVAVSHHSYLPQNGVLEDAHVDCAN